MMGKRFFIAFAVVMTTIFASFSQSYYIEDDIYYTPEDKNQVIEKGRQERAKTDSPQQVVAVVTKDVADASGSVQSSQQSGIVAERDIDEYNRRYATPDTLYYTAENTEEGTTFAYHSDEVAAGDTLYVQLEDGYYLNDFNGSQSDYEYTVQIHRFYDPRYTVSINDPAYTSIYMLDSSDWNVYIEGNYAWVTPTWSNPWYWSYTWSPFGYSSFSWRWGWGSPYYGWYDPWYYPYGYYGYHSPYYYGWYDPYYAWYAPHHHHYPGYYPGYYPGHHPGHYPGYYPGTPDRPDNRYAGNIVSNGRNGRGGSAAKDNSDSRGRRVSIDSSTDNRRDIQTSPSTNNRRGGTTDINNRNTTGRRTDMNTTVNSANRGANRTTINRNNGSSSSSSRSSSVGTSTNRGSGNSYRPSSSSSSRGSGSSYNPSRSSGSRSSSGGTRSSGSSGGSRGGDRGGRR